MDSEYLVTLLVVVPLSSINDWNAKYEKLTDMVVPRLVPSTHLSFQGWGSGSMFKMDPQHSYFFICLFCFFCPW